MGKRIKKKRIQFFSSRHQKKYLNVKALSSTMRKRGYDENFEKAKL